MVKVRGMERPLVRSEGVGGTLKLTSRSQTEELTSATTKRKSRSELMEEELYLHTEGDVFDAKLLTYFLGGGFGLSQQKYELGSESGSTSGELRSYDVRGNFLSGKPYPFSVGSRKGESIVSRQFLSPLHVENTSNSVQGRLRVPGWPMTFSWSESELNRSSAVGTTEDLYRRNDERFSYSVLHDFSERSHLDYRFDLNNLSQEGTSSTSDLETGNHRFIHDLVFGKDDEHNLNTSITQTNTKGDFKSDILNWSESLNLNHSERFMTFYNANYTKSKFQTAETETMGGAAGLRYRLYDNLTTTASGFGNKSDLGGGSETKWYGGKVRFDYYRHNPWGLLRSNYSFQTINRETSGDTGTDIVTDESHTFTDPFAVRLDKRNVIIDTIVVTDSSGTDIYTEGVDGDYTVRQVGDFVELVIDTLDADMPNITDGQEILVDYLYVVDNSTEQDIVQQDFRIEQKFDNGFSVYYSYLSRENNINVSQDLGSVNPSDEYATNIAGAGYENDRITLLAEHSETESTWNSTTGDRVSASAYWPLTSRTVLRGRVSQAWLNSSGNLNRDSTLFRAEGGFKSYLTKYMRLLGDGELRREDASDIGKTGGLRFGTGIEYRRRALSVRTGWDYYFLDRQNTDRTSTRFYLRLTREF
jgi:hypothetical protein